MLTFDVTPEPVVEVRVGISYVSVENARDNLQRENLRSDLATVHAQAEAQWDEELKRIELEGGTKEERQVFYTALYHCLIHPNYLDDANGQYPGMDDQIHKVAPGHHQYQNIPAWDQHRSHSPLIAFLYPKVASDIAQSLVNYAQQDASARPHLGGGLPRWEQVNHNSGGMVGDSDDTLISDALAFGAKDFDLQAAWNVMKKGASQPGTTSDGREVRQGLQDYLTLGFVPKDHGASVSVTLEYCNDDFALSRFAKSLGDSSSAEEYLRRAQNWKNLFESSTGYLRPRLKDGSWVSGFSATNGRGAFTEGTPAQYLWLVNFNYQALLDKIGGHDQVVARLDHFFTKLNEGTWKSEFAYMGNEPSEETSWVYDFACAPWRTQEVVRRIQTELFTDQPAGLPGNDDAGALSSWYVFSALGLYPDIPGVAGFVVGSPVFPKATIHLENGKAIQILGEQASQANPYVQSLKVNGQTWESSWVPWTELADGGVLDFNLGPQPSNWGNDPQKAPPSFDSK